MTVVETELKKILPSQFRENKGPNPTKIYVFFRINFLKGFYLKIKKNKKIVSYT